MECNKDEAFRAKGIAEKKLLKRDITGAKKFALKAQNLFPKLDGLSQFLVIIDVYVAHEKKINGLADYYGILDVDPLADEEVLRKQYKRLALSLHPDKNKSVEADGAFKIMHEAWSVLSDKGKRSAYHLKLKINAPNQNASFPSSSARYTSTPTNPQRAPTTPHTPGTATNSKSMPTQPQTPGGATNSRSVPTCSHTPGTDTNPRSVSPQPQTRGTSANPQSVPTRSHTPRTDTNSRSVPPQPQTPGAANKSRSVPVRPHTPGTATSQQCKSAPHHPRNAKSGSSSQHIPSCHQTPHKSPANPTRGTSSVKVPKSQKKPAATKNADFIHIPPHPSHQKTPAAETATQHTPSRSQSTYTTRSSKHNTFRALCDRCNKQYKYPKILQNIKLLCPYCQHSLASETPAPEVNSNSSHPSHFLHSHGSKSVPTSTTKTSQSASCKPPTKCVKRRHEEAVKMARNSNDQTNTKLWSTGPGKVEAASTSDAVSGLNRENPVKRRHTIGQK